MLKDFELSQLVVPLQNWFQNHARVLPWRENPTSYYVWISEIMLQQTRVEAVKPYFERFIKELPDVKVLAECPEDKLLKLWEGLGYYNRARNLKIAANQIMDEYGGVIPWEYEELLKLKGIGHYTAGAIASIAYGKAIPAVDGNVLRVISRVAADDSDIMKQSVRNHMEEALKDDADIYFVFSVQEEVGCRGSITATYAIAPTEAICVDVTSTGDRPGSKPMACALGKGAAIKIKDRSVICHEEIVNALESIAKENKIPVQKEILAFGGTDTSSMQLTGAGCKAGAISIPTRNVHTSVECCDMGDVEASVKLIEKYLIARG